MTKSVFGERRRYIRFNAESKINVQTKKKTKTKTSPRISAITKNLSVEGICFKADKKFKPGTIVRLSISLPIYPKPLHLEGKVVWSHLPRKRGNKRIFETGVKLFTVEKADENKFVGYVCDKMMARLGRYIHF